MALHKLRRGLDLPIAGAPAEQIDTAPQPRTVGLIAADYEGMRPTMHVTVGDQVRRGQLLFEDKKTPGVRFTAPAEGRVAAVNRGERRAFQSVVIEMSTAELGGRPGAGVSFASYTGRAPEACSEEQVRELLVESGAWTALRTRPFGRVADPTTRPRSIFVTAMDSNPHAPPLSQILAERPQEWLAGLRALAQLTGGPVFVCAAAGQPVDVPDHERIRLETFGGPHPAGTVGVHIHRLDPVDRMKLVWYLGLQDVIALGALFSTGELRVERVVALAGPAVRSPRLLRTRVGASIRDLTTGEIQEGVPVRRISGSVLSGRTANDDVLGYLGRYDQQVAVLVEDDEREFLGWLGPGASRFSVTNTFVSKLMPGRKFAMSTTTFGSERAIVPVGSYEKVFPFDILPTFLMRAISAGDVERAEELGALELEEEDVALLTFVCPGKNEYGPLLRDVLRTIEKEG